MFFFGHAHPRVAVGRRVRKTSDESVSCVSPCCVTGLLQGAMRAREAAGLASQIEKLESQIDGQYHAAARVDEIARMLGGVRITATTRQHADELLRQAREDAAAG